MEVRAPLKDVSYCIDVVFLNKNNMITKIIHTMKPFRFGMALDASSVLELMAGQADRIGIQPGDQLIWECV